MYFNVVVEQHFGSMIVVSCHEILPEAQKRAEELATENVGVIYAALELIGNPRQDYVPGDRLNHEDVWWPRPPNRCSECLDNCRPSNLLYCCPLTFGNPLCDAVAAARIHKPPLTDGLIKVITE